VLDSIFREAEAQSYKIFINKYFWCRESRITKSLSQVVNSMCPNLFIEYVINILRHIVFFVTVILFPSSVTNVCFDKKTASEPTYKLILFLPI
jgi:hypothetical protein